MPFVYNNIKTFRRSIQRARYNLIVKYVTIKCLGPYCPSGKQIKRGNLAHPRSNSNNPQKNEMCQRKLKWLGCHFGDEKRNK